MNLKYLKTSDGRGYKIVVQGRVKKSDLVKLRKELTKQYTTVLYNSHSHVFTVYGPKRLTQVGGGVYFSYEPDMTDMSCYIVAHLMDTDYSNSLWKFIASERTKVRRYCTQMIIPHITLYEYHLNCNVIDCTNQELIDAIGMNLLDLSADFMESCQLIVSRTNRYQIFGKQQNNKFIAMILDLLTDDPQLIDQYRQSIIGIVGQQLVGEQQLFDCTPDDEKDFVVLCDQDENRLMAIPDYHVNQFVPHVSIGSIEPSFLINQSFDVQSVIRSLNHRTNLPPADIGYLEVSFKNARLHYMSHYILDLSNRSIYQYNDQEYQHFLNNYLYTIM